MLIGISGKIGSGKDHIANFLAARIQAECAITFQRRSFAYKLKHITAILSGTSLDDQFTQDGKNKFIDAFGMTIGGMQQVLGTNVLRQWDEDVWVKALLSDYTNEKLDHWIITDVRFKNEAKAIKDRGGILIRVEGDPMGIRAASTRDMTHPSETDLDDYKEFDTIYVNDEIGEMKLTYILLPFIIDLINKKKADYRIDGNTQ